MEFIPKYQVVLETLEYEIEDGKYQCGQKIPSEMALVRRFKSSRITIGRAIRELAQRGFVERRPGSGTYVRQNENVGRRFGVLVAERGETEIFEPMCRGLVEASQARSSILLWGIVSPSSRTREERAWQTCRQFIHRKVSGVFFAPLEGNHASDLANQRIIEAFHAANIPVVLLDRDVLHYPQRSEYDLVGINNRRAGYVITQYLLQSGHARICFLGLPNSAPTVNERIAGYQEAKLGILGYADPSLVRFASPSDRDEVQRIVDDLHPDAFLCGNDRTALELMQTLRNLNYRIPEDVRIAGFDDVKDKSLSPVPFTTIHQPCREIGEVAMAAMLERLLRRDLPGRDITVDFKLTVRDTERENREVSGISQSTGSLAAESPSASL